MGHLRLDQLMVILKIAKSRTQAQDFIKKGLVYLNKGHEKRFLTKAAQSIEEIDWPHLKVENSEITRYASRAGLKLEGAVRRLNLSLEGLNCLDLGISTGGFTDFLIKERVSRVIGVDVGHDQLHSSLRGHPQLTLLEGENARYLLKSDPLRAHRPQGGFDLIVADLSFISLTLIISNIAPLLAVPEGRFLALVKPQFEVGPSGLDKKGIVNNPELYLKVESTIRDCCKNYGLNVLDYFSSILQGKDGNKEFFVFAKLT